MHLRTDVLSHLRPAVLRALVAAVLCGAQAVYAQADSHVLTDEQVQAAVKQVREDAKWGSQKTEKGLRFKPTADKSDPKSDPTWAVVSWLKDLVRWMTQAGRAAMWLLGAAAVAMLLVGARHWIRVRGDREAPLLPILPSHVSHLDIRPESLPDNVGDATAALWQRGEHRLALSLLYRGVLSRLVHQHGVPIFAASTEDECVALACTRLDPARAVYVQRMVGAWQRAVYGAELPQTALLLGLCHEFAVHFAGTHEQGAPA